MLLENTGGGETQGRKVITFSMLCELWLWQFIGISYILQVHKWFWLEICTGLFSHVVIVLYLPAIYSN